MRQIVFGPQGKGEGSSRFLETLRAELGDRFEFVAPLMPDIAAVAGAIRNLPGFLLA